MVMERRSPSSSSISHAVQLQRDAETEHEEDIMNPGSKKPQRQMVVLNFDEIDCKRLQLAGDFNNWVPDQDIETRNINGHWQKVFTATPGVYEYRIVVDGK